MIDALVPQIEEAKSDGAVVVMKWDGGRTSSHCTVVVTRKETDYVWRMDGADMASTFAEAMADYRANHAR